MSHSFKLLNKKNALALLPIPESCLSEIEETLLAINNGERGGVKGCITALTRMNKKNRFTKASWGRFAKKVDKIDLVITHTIITFDESTDNDESFFSFEACPHGTSQSPMFMLSFDRCSGSAPKDTLTHNPNTYVMSRRVVSIPLQCILNHWGNAESGHMIYEHNVSAMDHNSQQFKSNSYIGLTSRNWQTRYKEHQRDALNGSELLFHTTLASMFEEGGVSQIGMGPYEMVRNGVCLTSELQYLNLTYDEAMQFEERMIERSTLNPKGLNMIPGGFAGMKYLHKLRYLSHDRVSVEDRDFAAAKYLLEKTPNGRVAPWVTESWSKDAFYEQVIFNRSNTLNREQVLSIRKYGNEWGFNAEIIANLSGANIRQVRDVLSEKYYSRVK